MVSSSFCRLIKCVHIKTKRQWVYRKQREKSMQDKMMLPLKKEKNGTSVDYLLCRS